ncbi:heme ABC transporter ATP-binding protein [Oricola thermophila]|uniref:Heme ABC transporter ATP-binding protein n=1 Tax=Oricola thermophila TaxID=2742145 RepID=A0A6N1VHI3_9HYPH|nr:heme ABC transporter ATP-binding protein [Oricola thermophila]QKV20371.1 heme ABC transporter ATP-binding protein [Oricola thermophila]
MLVAQNIEVRLSRKKVLDGVSLTVPEGRLSVVIGPNGSGKTTLLRALSGDLPYSGHASLHSLDIARAKPWELATLRGVLPQSSNLSFPFTVREIVGLGTREGLTEDDRDVVSAALARVDLAGFEGRMYQELSGGEQQRVQLARVLCQVWSPVIDGKARYLFLDEPVSSLDIRHQLQIMNVARDFAVRGGGVLAILHDLNLTAIYADHVVLLKNGRIHAAGTPADVLTASNLQAVYDCELSVNQPPQAGSIFVLPHQAHSAAGQPQNSP